MAVGAVAAVLAGTVPVAVVASLRDDPSAGPPPADRTAEPLVTCGVGSWPVSVMDGGLPEVAADPEVRAAVEALPAQLGIDSPDVSRWIVLAADDDGVTIGTGAWSAASGPSRRAETVRLTRADDGALRPAGGGDCRLAVVTPPGRWQVDLAAPGGGVDPTTDRPVVLATERQCTSGRDPRPYLSDPVVVETADRVVVTLTSRGDDEAHTCEGNPSVPVALDLEQPLGDREVVDGGTWPRTPLEVADDGVEAPWRTVEHAGVAVDVPADWRELDRTTCPSDTAGFEVGLPRPQTSGLHPCDATTGLRIGSAAALGAAGPHHDGDAAVAGQVVRLQVTDAATTRRILASARPAGEPAPPVDGWRTADVDATLVADVPVGAGVRIDVSAGYPDCAADTTPARPEGDGTWRAGYCVDRVVTVTAPTQALADLVVASIRPTDRSGRPDPWRVAVLGDVLVELPGDWASPPGCSGLAAAAPQWGPADGGADCREVPGVSGHAAGTFDAAEGPGLRPCDVGYCGYRRLGDAVVVVRAPDEATAQRVLDSATPT
ncbi:hypothetical protein FE634_06180 [Nocardioides dongxiaopingii]|uniref:hypothetical protein n=1 Tax=Nocardioides sp. S-1144 TaxID=2582905 RepID=UPI00116310CE|nr:hypothetical protein [Nocardioides sp. S-1144]QCW50096.2 hypothetical protein FE634_06180 [Nocardioides sp. S-1144]